MATNERTSARIARLSAQGLANPASLTLYEIREICGSNLTQAPDRNPPKSYPFGLSSVPAGAHAFYNRLAGSHPDTVLDKIDVVSILEDNYGKSGALARYLQRSRT
jgi:hypothetical protein